jgi:catechol 2,3-dioxygenase-like lactoylglutathione lyase family enzyme
MPAVGSSARPWAARARRRSTASILSLHRPAPAADDKQLAKTIARYGRIDLLCIDELGYMALDRRRPTMLGDMTILRMDNVLIVVDDLDAVISFFVELGMELEGKGPIEGRWVERVIGIDDVRQDVAMLRTPDGHSRIELAMFHTPKAISGEPKDAPANTLGIRRIMFAVDDIEDVLARLRTHGAELVGGLEQYEDSYRLCYVRGPEGIIVGLAEPLS